MTINPRNLRIEALGKEDKTGHFHVQGNRMPILAALDECTSALTKISIYAELGLEDAALQPEALRSIQQCCGEIDETLHDILSKHKIG